MLCVRKLRNLTLKFYFYIKTSTGQWPHNVEYNVKITEIYSRTFFRKYFVKVTVLLNH